MNGKKHLNSSLRFRFGTKKANAFMDIMLVVLVLLGMAIIGFVASNLLSELNTDIQADSEMPVNAKALSNDLTTRFPTFMDGAFLFAFILLWIFVIVSSVMLDSHPLFFVVTLILLLFAFGVVMMIGNTFEEFAEEPEYATMVADFPITYFLMTHLLVIVIIMGATILIALYGKNKFVGT